MPKMNAINPFRPAMVALLAMTLGGAALAQSPVPSASPSASPAPAPAVSASPAPAETPAPAASATPAPGTSPPPAAAQTPAVPPAATVQTADPFGEQFALEPKKV